MSKKNTVKEEVVEVKKEPTTKYTFKLNLQVGDKIYKYNQSYDLTAEEITKFEKYIFIKLKENKKKPCMTC